MAAVPQSEQDENMIEMAGDDVDVPEELLKMVDEDATEEEGKDSILGQFQNLQNMDADQLKEKASATITELKSKAEEKCSVMWGAGAWQRTERRAPLMVWWVGASADTVNRLTRKRLANPEKVSMPPCN